MDLTKIACEHRDQEYITMSVYEHVNITTAVPVKTRGHWARASRLSALEKMFNFN